MTTGDTAAAQVMTTPAPPLAAPAVGRAALFAASVFVGAFLLFQVQPLIGKYILPWFGGSPAVWTTCLLFFQVMLLGGYAYAHGLTTYLSARTGAVVHVAMMLAALAVLPVVPAAGWKPVDPDNPIPRILLLLLATVGLPYFVLSATGPLLQAWYARLTGGRSPYRFYALSNVGSLLALISYPFLVEPALSRRTQGLAWSAGLVAFVACCGGCAALVWRRGARVGPAEARGTEPLPEAPPTRGRRAMWLLLPMAATVLLLAVTNKLCQEVAPVPFLWVLPLALYLLTFVIAFDGPRWYVRPLFAFLLVLAVGAGLVALAADARLSLVERVAAYAGTLFVGCMVCHGELYRLRPDAARLTGFYLMISAGGAIGGALVAVVAPLVFSGFHELIVGLLATWVLALIAYRSDETWLLGQPESRVTWFGLHLFTAFLAAMVAVHVVRPARAAVARERSFYGVMSVARTTTNDGEALDLYHGVTRHGLQLQRPDLRRTPTTYYGPGSGAGLAVRAMNGRPGAPPVRVGVVGLGTGTLAAYGRAGDAYQFYEIDAAVERLARQHFTFLADSPADTAVVLGDARLTLERQPPQAFDLLVLDAFSSDAIPVHLLTEQAFELYLRHLAADGLLAVHISNRHLDLRPVLAGAAGRFGLAAAVVEDRLPRGNDAANDSLWVVLARDPAPLRSPPFEAAAPLAAHPRALWTDDWSNLLELIR